jgi:hypothetical protein
VLLCCRNQIPFQHNIGPVQTPFQEIGNHLASSKLVPFRIHKPPVDHRVGDLGETLLVLLDLGCGELAVVLALLLVPVYPTSSQNPTFVLVAASDMDRMMEMSFS